MRKISLMPWILLFVMLATPVQAQWAKSYAGIQDENPLQVLLTKDGDLLVAGFTQHKTEGTFTYYTYHSSLLMRLSGNGVRAEAWLYESDKTGAEPDVIQSDEWIRSLAPTGDGGFILVGHTEKRWIEEDGTSRVSNGAFVMKLFSDLQIEWQRVYGNDDQATKERLMAVTATSGESFVAVGSTTSFGMGGSDFLVMKLDSLGQTTWQKAYGGAGEDVANLILETQDGGFYVVGHTSSFRSEAEHQEGELPETRIWILRLNPEGALIWQRMYGRDGDVATALAMCPDGGFWILGSTREDRGEGIVPGSDILILKLSDQGQIVFQRSFGNETDEKITQAVWKEGNKILGIGTQTKDGDEDLLVIQFAETGHIDWMKIFGFDAGEGEISQENGSAIITVENDEIVAIGRTSQQGAEGDDLLVLRLMGDGRVPNCDLIQPLDRYPLKDLGDLPVDTSVDFTPSGVLPLNITFHPVTYLVGMVRDVCVAKKNLLRR